MRAYRIRKMPHHLRLVRGIYQVQLAVSKPLREAVAAINGKRLSKAEREAGCTVPEQDWLIKSTSTGNLSEAERIRDEQIMPEFKRILLAAELRSDPETLAAALINRNPPHGRRVSQSIINEASARLGVIYSGDVPAERAEAVIEIIKGHFAREQTHIDNVDSLVTEIREGLPEYPIDGDQWMRLRAGILAALTQPTANLWEPVEFETILEDWKNLERKDDTDDGYVQMKGRWRDFFDWLVEKRNWPQGCCDLARIEGEDLDAYKSHLLALLAKGEIRSKTVEWKIGRVTKLLRHGIEEMRNKTLIARNPLVNFKNIKGETDPKDKYQDFSRGNVLSLLDKSRTASPEIKWPMWLAAYSVAARLK